MAAPGNPLLVVFGSVPVRVLSESLAAIRRQRLILQSEAAHPFALLAQVFGVEYLVANPAAKQRLDDFYDRQLPKRSRQIITLLLDEKRLPVWVNDELDLTAWRLSD